MESNGTKINIKSKVFRELYTLTWHIEDFDMIPFFDDHPICGPSFSLGKHKDTTWSLLMLKQEHGMINGEKVKNIGFRLVRSEDDTNWCMVTLSLSVMLEDGRLVKCVDKEILAGDSEDLYVFVIPSLESEGYYRTGMCGTTVHIKNSPGLEGSVTDPQAETLISKSMKIENDVEGICCRRTFIDENASKKVECGHHLNGSKEVCNCCNIFRKSKVTDQKKGALAESDSGSELLKLEIDRSLKRQPKIELCPVSDANTKVQKDVQELKPDDLFKLKDLVVVCSMEYTYMVSDNFENGARESDESDFKEIFKYLHDTGRYSDVTLVCENVDFPCHKAVLCPRSTLFEQLLKSTSSVTPVKVNLNLQMRIARAVVMYIYTGELQEGMSADDYKELCDLADYVGVIGMKKSCLEKMKHLEYEECPTEEEKVASEKASPEKITLEKASQSLISIISSAN